MKFNHKMLKMTFKQPMLVYIFTTHTNLKESIYISMGSAYMLVNFTHSKKYMGKIYLSHIKQNPWKTKGLNGANREARTPDPLITNQ